MRRDAGAGARRARVLQFLFMQGALAVLLLTFALVSWGDAQAMLVFGSALIVPVGWGLVSWNVLRRDEAARSTGSWTKEWSAGERKRALGWLALFVVTWLVVSGAAIAFL